MEIENDKTQKMLDIIIRLVVGLVTIAFLLLITIQIAELYRAFQWSWPELVIVLVITAGILFGAYLIGVLIFDLIPKLTKKILN